ncbi:MAG TPA: DNA gyrase subunit A [Gammaproteobacteria bacterium]|nr:DNA gyrase subunit A [Gammaproteobacteria bacterium]
MSTVAQEILTVNLEDEMRQSYLDYAMSVIVGRALPDVRDGLKPVHRRVLHAMRELGNDWNKPYKKSARVVGDVIGKYHPHGDSAVYDTIVRMAQPFAMRYMLVDGQGNFGSIDGDSAAAMRYTEVRMSRIAHELMADIDKETVDFGENYDGSEREPLVLPSRVPNLLVNGSAGIAVGMATNIPPHNLGEVIDACVALIDDETLDIEALLQYLPAPDLPTAGIINGVAGIHEAYRTGRGRMIMRARSHIEEDERTGRQSIIVTELPYQVNKAKLIEKIAELAKEKRLEGIAELRDESDKDGIRVVIDLRRGEIPEVVLNNLFQHTQMQTVFGINMVALVDGQPRLLNVKQILEAFLRHRREVVTRRTVFELRKARERAHILEGLAVALANIDEIIALIKASPGPAEAREALLARPWQPGIVSEMLARAEGHAYQPEDLAEGLGMEADGYRLSAAQAQAILELRLHRLTGLEQDKIIEEYKGLLADIDRLLAILGSGEELMRVVRAELLDIRERYNDPRRSEIIVDSLDLTLEDLITPQDVVVTLSHGGYAKSQPVSSYEAQRRGGKGKSATRMKEEDFIDKLFIANTHDTLLCFSSRGKCYWLKVYELPQGSRAARGRPIVNLLPLEPDERINAVLPIKEFDDKHYVFMATSRGTVKKTPLIDFSRPRSNGIIAVDLRDDDVLVNVGITDGERDVMLFTDGGRAMRFHESEVRAMGRTATGVRGIRLQDDQQVIQLLILGEGTILTATENGFGKRTPADEYPAKGRGGMGVISIRTSERNGKVVAASQVSDEDEIMLITRNGTLVRTRANEVSVLSRNTQGVRLISLEADDQLVGVERVEAYDEDDGAEDGGNAD